ncbi:MAG: hypothetical protein ACJ79L_02110 [Anaeromyxobacteraceae bacterium]
MSRLALAAGLAALVACSRPRPSPEYEEARQRWAAIAREQGDAAAEDPRADGVLSLLAKVPAESLDAPGAAELRARIEGERRARAEERERRARLVAGAGALPSMPASSAGGGAGAGGAGAPAEGPGATPAALAPGTTLDAFRAATGDCFERRGPIQIGAPDGGAASPGEAWALRGDAGCQERWAAASGKLVLFTGGSLTALSPASAARTVETRERVKLGTLPDGGVGILTDAGVVAPPPGAQIIPDAPGARDGGGR